MTIIAGMPPYDCTMSGTGKSSALSFPSEDDSVSLGDEGRQQRLPLVTHLAQESAAQLDGAKEEESRGEKILKALSAKRKAEEDLRALSVSIKRPNQRTDREIDLNESMNNFDQRMEHPVAHRQLQINEEIRRQQEQALRFLPEPSAIQHMSGINAEVARAGLLYQQSFQSAQIPGFHEISSYHGHLPQAHTGLLVNPGIAAPYPYFPPPANSPHPETYDSLPGYPRSALLLPEQREQNAALAEASYTQQLMGLGATTLPALHVGDQTLNSLLVHHGNLQRQPPRPVPLALMQSEKVAKKPPAENTFKKKIRSADYNLSQEKIAHPPLNQPILSFPPCNESSTGPYSNRGKYPLGIDEDHNWLSEFHCFVRADIVEVFRASKEDCRSRNNAIASNQIGIRCRFCAHVPPGGRAGRSSAFPSSIRQIYQSFTMMLRDHFFNCQAMPSPVQRKFLTLKEMPSTGATDSKRYWVFSAEKIGMVDTPQCGISISDGSVATGKSMAPFGTTLNQDGADDELREVPVVFPEDKSLVNSFLFLLVSQVQLVRLSDAERIGNRRNLNHGLPGIGCRFCSKAHRLGHSRLFPAKRRLLPKKMNDLYDHIRRCSLVPEATKKQLESAISASVGDDQEGEREFYDRIWARISGESKIA